MSDFNYCIILWTQDSRKLFDDKSKWLEVGFRDLSQIISKLALEDERESVGYNNFFQRLYCLIRYRLILDWDLTAKDRFSALQSARGQIGGKISKGGGRPPKKTEALLTKVREMKSDGLSDRAIAKQIKVSPTTIGKWLKSV